MRNSERKKMNKKLANANGGVKYDQDKLMFDLLEPEFEEGIVAVLTYGARKYAPDNWQKIERKRYIAAFGRHMNAWKKGERNDRETGYSHLYHAACCLMFLDWFDRNRTPIPSIVRDFEVKKPTT